MIDRKPLSGRLWLAAALLLAWTASAGSAEDEIAPVADASNDAQLAIQRFRVPSGLSTELVAAEPELANPVAFCFDEQGRIYVAETFRQDHGVEDNRGHMNWLEDDLSLTTVEQRGEMFRRYLPDEVQEWARRPERIRQLSDLDGDGRYETATVFATGFNDILDGTGAGLLAHRGDLFYTCIPNLWRLRDTNHDGRADERTVLHHGFGVRVAFRGHDMHGLVRGPDGRLYFSIGDRGYNVLTDDGRQLQRPDTGAVFRCDLDGSGLEVFAYGLRNPQELAFNDEGDLFAGDNNSDGGDRARWVYVAPQGDSGWRMYYQYLDDRGPWNRERIWYPYRSDERTAAVQPAYIVPPIKNVADGPAGLVFDPGVGLPERFRGCFFLVDFRGSPANSGVRSFRAAQHGAGFELTDSEWFLQSLLATDVDFGLDGAMYVLDWVDGWNGDGKGRIYRMKFEGQGSASPSAEALFHEGFTQRSTDELFSLLSHVDRRVRLEAQFTLADRAVAELGAGPDQGLVARLWRLAAGDGDEPATRHAMWAVGQVLRQTGRRAGSFRELATQPGAEQRRQAYRIVSDLPRGLFDGTADWSPDLLTLGLRDPEPRVQFAAALAVAVHGTRPQLEPLLELLAANQDSDPFLRHAAVMGLTGAAEAGALLERADHPSRSVRLGVLVALRRLRHPGVARFLNDGDQAIVVEAARAIHDLWIAEAAPDLADQVTRPGLAQAASTPLGKEWVRRILNTNNRLGGSAGAAAVASIASQTGCPDDVRNEAARELLNWSNPPRLDVVTNEFRPIGERPQAEAETAVRGALPGLLGGSNELRETAVKLAAKYEISDVGPMLIELAREEDSDARVRAEALAALAQLHDPGVPALVDVLLSDGEPRVRAEARLVLARLSPDRAVDILAQAIDAPGAAVVERQSAVSTLAGIETDSARQVLSEALTGWAQGHPVAPEIQLEFLEAGRQNGDAGLSALVEQIEAARPTDDPLASSAECLLGGDAARGQAVFFGNAAASCRRCHKINGEGGEVGPDLSEIGRQKPRDYLLESLVNPNAKIAQGFETAVFAMDDGRVHSGIVKKEDETVIQLVTPQGDLLTLEKAHVDDRAKGQSGMPSDIVKQISRRDIRDLVEFLSGLKEKQEPAGHQ